MDSAMEHQNVDSGEHSVGQAWHHCQEIPTAKSFSEAWESVKKMFDALPPWAMVVGGVSLFMIATNTWILPMAAAAGCTMAAVFYTVKQAVRQALREHDAAKTQ